MLKVISFLVGSDRGQQSFGQADDQKPSYSQSPSELDHILSPKMNVLNIERPSTTERMILGFSSAHDVLSGQEYAWSRIVVAESE